MFVVLVAGGRTGVSKQAVCAVLDKLSALWPKDTAILHGKARGVDSHADWWARDRGYSIDPTPIDPALDGFKEDAPKKRNRRMADKQPDLAVVFQGGPGSRDMFEVCEKQQIPIYDVEIFHENQFRVWRINPRERAVVIATGSF